MDLCKLDLSLHYRQGNATKILTGMDMLQAKSKEDMSYNLAGIIAVQLTLAYGKEEKNRNRLLSELATQHGDLSFLSFSDSKRMSEATLRQ